MGWTAAAAGVLASSKARAEGLAKREYKNGVKLSVIGFGGIVIVGMEQTQADRTVAEAFDRGVNYFDVAPSYFDGEAETEAGAGLVAVPLQGVPRLQDHGTGRGRRAQGARAEPRAIEDGAFRPLPIPRRLEPRRRRQDRRSRRGGGGLPRSPGERAGPFSGRVGARRRGRDILDGPVPSRLDHVPGEFRPLSRKAISALRSWSTPKEGRRPAGPEIIVLHRLARRRTHTAWPKCWYKPIDDPALAEKAVRFTLSEDVTAAIPPGEEKLFRMALDCAGRFRPLGPKEREDLMMSARGVPPIFRA